MEPVMTDLVKRLRDWQHVHPEDYNKPEGHLYEEAADRIEELEAEVGRLRAAFRVNMLRQGYSHDEIDEVIRAEGEE
jgi:hypothetical protein